MNDSFLLAAWKLDGNGGGVELDGIPDEEPAVCWAHLNYGEPGIEPWLLGRPGMSAVTVEALVATDPRPRSVLIGDALLVVLRGINTNSGSEPDDMVSLRLYLEANRIITVRRRRLSSVADIQARLTAGNGPADTGEVLVAILDAMTDRIAETVVRLDEETDELEELILTQESRDLRMRIGGLRRDVIGLRRYIAPQRDAVAKLQSERVSWLTDEHRARLREQADRVARCVEDLDSIRDRAAVSQEELNNRIGEQMNATMYVLSIVAAIFLPLGLLTGLLGINVGGMPGVESPYAFTLVTLLLVVLGIGLTLFFRARRLI